MRTLSTDERGQPPNQRTGTEFSLSPTELPGKLTSTAALLSGSLPAPEELGIINLVPEHDEGADEQFARDRYFRLRFAPALHHLLVEVPELFIAPGGSLPGFDQQVAQQSRPGFADPAVDFAFGGRVLSDIQPDVSRHLACAAKARDVAERVD